MEKIIELLNEAIKNGLDFQGNDILKIEYYSEMDIRAYYDKTARAYYNITIEDIISKRAGFIQRLIENDKIHCGKVIGEYGKTVGAKFISEPIQYNDLVCICLMLLSIQDDPVDFLISILN